MTAQRKSPIRPAGHRSEAAQRRLNEIISAAVDIINARGFNGMSLQGVADRVGITQAGVLHYVGDKQGLLVEVIRHYYNCSSSMQDYLSLFVPNGSLAGQLPKIPEFCRLIVAENAHQPELVLLFQILNTEAISRDSPTHEYFAQRSKEVSDPSHGRDWSVPEGVDAKLALSVAMAAMYGLEGRWLARPDEIDYETEWARFENFLFPLPQWEGYR